MTKEKFKISRLGLGTVQFGMDYGFSKALTQNDVNGILSAAHEQGVDFLDTARAYGDSEEKVGNYIRQNPGHFTVCTKLEEIGAGTARHPEKVEQFIADSLDRSKRALGKSFLPMFLLHQTDGFVVDSADFWSALKRIKERRGFKFGISVYDPEPTKEILEKQGDVIDCIQAPYNVVDRRFESLAGLLHEKGIVFIGRSTFLKGALVEKKIPTELKDLEPVRKKLREISKKTGLTVSQLLVHFSLSSPVVDCALIGVRSIGQLRENLDLDKSREEFREYRQELSAISVDNPFLKDPRQWKTL